LAPGPDPQEKISTLSRAFQILEEVSSSTYVVTLPDKSDKSVKSNIEWQEDLFQKETFDLDLNVFKTRQFSVKTRICKTDHQPNL
jgi:hypothetical protein